jgi:hypothetical protein
MKALLPSRARAAQLSGLSIALRGFCQTQPKTLNPVMKLRPAVAQVAIALGVAVYLWNAGTGVIEELCATTEEDDYITSLSWAADGALGLRAGLCFVQSQNRPRDCSHC